MSEYKVVTTGGGYTFTGKYLKERETTNWHYYETDKGEIIHFRKEHMVMVVESPEEENDHAES